MANLVMKLSKGGECALRALIGPGTTQALGRPLFSLNELTDKGQIFFQLRSAGHKASACGQRGG